MRSFGIILMTLIVNAAAAQYTNQYNTAGDARKFTQFTIMRGSGIGMTFLGAAVALVGLANIHATATSHSGNSPYYHTPVNSGEIIATLGCGVMATGITLWAIGNHQMKVYRERLHIISINSSITQKHAGITLTYRF